MKKLNRGRNTFMVARGMSGKGVDFDIMGNFDRVKIERGTVLFG